MMIAAAAAFAATVGRQTRRGGFELPLTTPYNLKFDRSQDHAQSKRIQ